MALSVAVLLAGALIYTSFSASTEAKEPSQLANATPGTTYQMTGEVVPGSIEKQGNGIAFHVVDREGSGSGLPVAYTGTVPPAFKGGREIVLNGAMEKDGTFVGEPETLSTKCPSKFTTASNG